MFSFPTVALLTICMGGMVSSVHEVDGQLVENSTNNNKAQATSSSDESTDIARFALLDPFQTAQDLGTVRAAPQKRDDLLNPFVQIVSPPARAELLDPFKPNVMQPVMLGNRSSLVNPFQ